MPTPEKVLSAADYAEMVSLVSAATAAARESEWATWQQSVPLTDAERTALRKKADEAYHAVCVWAAERTRY